MAQTATGAPARPGVRYMPSHLEDPARPGWLLREEVRRRRRAWMKSKDRDQAYAEAWAAGGRCVLCGISFVWGEPPYMSIDHIVPLARGGTSDHANLQVLCEPCNFGKGAR